METLRCPELVRSRAHMNVHNIKPSTGTCDICQYMVKLKKCPGCNVSFMCPYCAHHYGICNYCCNANVMLRINGSITNDYNMSICKSND